MQFLEDNVECFLFFYDRCFSAKCCYHMFMDPFECGILAALAIV